MIARCCLLQVLLLFVGGDGVGGGGGGDGGDGGGVGDAVVGGDVGCVGCVLLLSVLPLFLSLLGWGCFCC